MKDTFIKRLVKKDYNDKLEEILSKKNFSEDVKNNLLAMFYKIENGYDDYLMVKRNTFQKKDYILNLIDIIEKYCNSIIFLKTNSKKKICVDKNRREIICFPIEKNILYCLAQIQKSDNIVDYLDNTINEAISYVFNIGNNINLEEPLRDFNGFSWNIVKKEIENIECNLIYQDIIYLVSYNSVDKWINQYDPLVDYLDLFKNEIEKKYGETIKNSIIDKIAKLSILIKYSQDDIYKEKILSKRIEISNEKEKYNNITKYITDVALYKKLKEKEIRKIDKILNDKDLLFKEYEKRNKILPLDKKVFSVRVLKNILNEERNSLIENIKLYNKKISPDEFLKNKKIFEQKYEIICNINIEETKKEIKKYLVELQEDIVKCICIDVEKTVDFKKIIDNIYIYRYFSFLPISKEKDLKDNSEINVELRKLLQCIVKKSIDLKIINQIYDDENKNLEIMEKIFLSKIISIQTIYIKINSYEKDIIMTIYDEDVEDSKIIIVDSLKDNYKIKFNKKVRLFI